MLPKPLQQLYDRAALFLDKDSTHQDHYWAVGIHKAIHKAFPDFKDCGGSHTATAHIAKEKHVAMKITRKGLPSCQDPPLVRNHVCETPDRCNAASLLKEES